MSFISFSFFIFLLFTLLLYYIIPLNLRWLVLLIGSVFFYYTTSVQALVALSLHILISYIGSRILSKVKNRTLLTIVIILDLLPLLILKYHIIPEITTIKLVIPLGISFYTLQTIAYHIDIYKQKIEPEKNILKYGLFISFFPQILQGPIPRYEQLKSSLFIGHSFCEEKFTKGFHLILWSLFLKLMIADKAGIVVNIVFDNHTSYYGLYYLVAGILYSIQLYTDFLSCTTLSQGISLLFGIELVDNFDHPYFACSIKDFWRRWHLSLSSWLRDYIYIPLGGNRHGKFRKNMNLLLTFAISGLWHGVGIKFLCWGILHGIYQIIGDLTMHLRNCIYTFLRIPPDSALRKNIQYITTFLLVTFGWIIFRASSLSIAGNMIFSIITEFTPWILFDDSLLQLGLDLKEWIILALSIYILYNVSKKQEHTKLSSQIANTPLIIRWGIYIGVILVILLFGSYGIGYNAQSFIYEGF